MTSHTVSLGPRLPQQVDGQGDGVGGGGEGDVSHSITVDTSSTSLSDATDESRRWKESRTSWNPKKMGIRYMLNAFNIISFHIIFTGPWTCQAQKPCRQAAHLQKGHLSDVLG